MENTNEDVATATSNTVDVTPTWADVLPAYVAVLQSGNADGRKVACYEMRNMARAADHGNRCAKALRDIATLLSTTDANLDNEDQPGGPQCPTGDTHNDLARTARHLRGS